MNRAGIIALIQYCTASWVGEGSAVTSVIVLPVLHFSVLAFSYAPDSDCGAYKSVYVIHAVRRLTADFYGATCIIRAEDGRCWSFDVYNRHVDRCCLHCSGYRIVFRVAFLLQQLESTGAKDSGQPGRSPPTSGTGPVWLSARPHYSRLISCIALLLDAVEDRGRGHWLTL